MNILSNQIQGQTCNPERLQRKRCYHEVYSVSFTIHFAFTRTICDPLRIGRWCIHFIVSCWILMTWIVTFRESRCCNLSGFLCSLLRIQSSSSCFSQQQLLMPLFVSPVLRSCNFIPAALMSRSSFVRKILNVDNRGLEYNGFTQFPI